MARLSDFDRPDDPRLVPVEPARLSLLEEMVRAYYREDGHRFDDVHQPAALRALVTGDPLGCAWFVEQGGRPIGYVVLTFGFSIEAGGREACVDELFLVEEIRNQGVGRKVLDLVEAEARRRGVRRVFLEVERHNRAIGLYRRAGYADHDRTLLSKFLDR